MSGRLILVGTPIGHLGDLSPRAVDSLTAADVIACEDTRVTRKLLSHAGIRGKRLSTLNAHNEASAGAALVELASSGAVVVVASDAGMPGISDPGARVVREALAAGVAVEVVPGPSAALTALVASGLATDRFCFEGFLPRKGRAREQRLAALAVEERTIVLYESPHRVAATLADLVAHCGSQRPVAVARELTKLHEEVWRGSLGDALDHHASTPARGEHVLVLAGAVAQPIAAGDDEIDAALSERLGHGVDHKAAVAEVAAALGVPKRQVYDAGLRLRGRGARAGGAAAGGATAGGAAAGGAGAEAVAGPDAPKAHEGETPSGEPGAAR